MDAADKALFNSTYGKKAGEPGFLWYFDYNGDGVVDKKDRQQFNIRA